MLPASLAINDNAVEDTTTVFRPTLTALLVAAMAISTLTANALGLLAIYVLDALQISRAQLGSVIAIGTMIGALVSVPAGRAVDKIGARNAVIVVFAATGSAFLVFAAAPSYGIMIVGSAVAAAALGGNNPATNKVIALHYPEGRRSLVTGLKQSGVPLAVVASGTLLPTAAEAIGWRHTLGLVGVTAMGLALLSRAAIPAPESDTSPPASLAAAAGSTMGRMALYPFLLGFANASIFFIPLFAEEILGSSAVRAGRAIAVLGAAAMVGRIAWARVAERRRSYVGVLRLLAAVGAVAYLVVALSARFGGWWQLVAGCVLIGASASSWNAVGMLAVIHEAGTEGAGRASGVVQFGFLLGLSVGTPVQGWTVDLTGAYTVLWLLSTAAAAVAWIVLPREQDPRHLRLDPV
jgi:predicted MFS family arabinose efflux permease